MRVIHCISGLRQDRGGPSRSVPGLVCGERHQGVEASLLYVRDGSVREPPRTENANPIAFDPSFPKRLARSSSLKSYLLNGGEADVYHGHGLWELPVHYMAHAARKRSKPYLMAPRGMLDGWALGQSPWCKRAARWLYQDTDLRRADCLHAVAPGEAASFRRCGLTNPIAVIPNGVDLSDFSGAQGLAGLFEELFPEARGRPVLLFLSRIHAKKGLLLLARAWARARPDHPEWLLVIAGPDTAGHRGEVQLRVAGLDLTGSVLFTGGLYGQRRLAAFAAADAFVLPSFSEGFSVAVLEAMACRLPVLITQACNFPAAQAKGAGFIVRPTPEGVEAGLRRMLELPEGRRVRMGACGRQMIEQDYTWDRIAARMIRVYGWLLGRCRRPSCVAVWDGKQRPSQDRAF